MLPLGKNFSMIILHSIVLVCFKIILIQFKRSSFFLTFSFRFFFDLAAFLFGIASCAKLSVPSVLFLEIFSQVIWRFFGCRGLI